MKTIKKMGKKTGKEATLQTELQQSAAPKADKGVAKKAQKVADQNKKDSAPGIPSKRNSAKQAGSATDMKPTREQKNKKKQK